MDLERIIDVAFPKDNNHNMQRDRPYKGQQHTDQGERGKQEIHGITMRDLADCYLRAVCLSTGETPYYHEADKGVDACLSRNDLFELDWNSLDPLAVQQNLTCDVEKIMSIFPNIPR